VGSDPVLMPPESARPRSRTPLYLGIVVAVLAAALVIYLQFAPRPAVQEIPLTQEAKDYLPNLKLTDVGMKASLNYFSQKVVEIEGNIGNTGGRTLQVVEIYCVFYDTAGQPILRQRVPIVSERMGGLAPGETKPFRLPFDAVPEGWNQQLPQLVIAGVTFL
jgi:hypothetical protein